MAQPNPAGTSPCGLPDLRPLGWGWTASLLLAALATITFGQVSGRAAVFGHAAWAAVCAVPVLLGLVLAFTSTQDRQQYAARGLAAALIGPIGLAMWAGTAEGPPAGLHTWLLGLGLLLLCLLAWLALLLWMARLATRISPPAGTPLRPWSELQARLQSLTPAGAPWSVSARSADELELELQLGSDGTRGHWVKLRADQGRGTVEVIETLRARGATPLAHEASFRRPGDPLVDAARPPVQSVSGRARQTTMLTAADLAAWPAAVTEGDVALPAGWATADFEGRGRLALALLARVVLASGWHWQPRLFGRG
jgi:hypothetical protein